MTRVIAIGVDREIVHTLRMWFQNNLDLADDFSVAGNATILLRGINFGVLQSNNKKTVKTCANIATAHDFLQSTSASFDRRHLQSTSASFNRRHLQSTSASFDRRHLQSTSASFDRRHLQSTSASFDRRHLQLTSASFDRREEQKPQNERMLR